jgi:nifR3 family TIM-barrel protein
MEVASSLSSDGQAWSPRGAILAPMSGVSDAAFRRVAARFGASYVVTEMVGSEALIRRDAEARLRAEGAGLNPHVVQLVGREPDAMAEAARLAEGAGAHVVDLNFGCPAKRVTGGLAGSALMREPEKALGIVEAVARAVRVPVTVKMRLGWDGTSLNAASLARAAADLGASGFTIHGRTRQQFYAGCADWPAIRDVVAAVPRPVVANGDVACLDTARRCLATSGAAAVMIGRAATGQPWLVGMVAAGLAGLSQRRPSAAARAEAACEHYEGLLALYGQEVGLRHARKHLAAYAERALRDGFAVPPAVARELVTSEDTRRVAGLLGGLWNEPLREAA